MEDNINEERLIEAVPDIQLIFTVANEQVGKNHVPNYFGK
jgi:hypothetical protein